MEVYLDSPDDVIKWWAAELKNKSDDSSYEAILTRFAYDLSRVQSGSKVRK